MKTLTPNLIPDDVLAIYRRLAGQGHSAYLVGGSVRDLLLGRPPGDFDVATSAPPEQVMQLFGQRYAVPTGLRHGTVTVLGSSRSEGRHVEVTTFRSEGAYLDGRRPETVRFGATLDEDLSRRDFTMNAIAYDPGTDVIVDPHDGRADLARRCVRAVGNPVERFREDGLRPMRAVRQAAQLGFTLDPATHAAIPAALDVFRQVSAERIRDELGKLLGAPTPSQGIDLMRETGLLGAVIPELLEGVGQVQHQFHRYDVYRHTLETLDSAPAGDAGLRLGALLHDVAKPRTQQPRPDAPGQFTFFRHEHLGAEMADDICRRLKLPTTEREDVVELVAHHMFFYRSDWTDGSVRRFVRRVGQERLARLLALREADISGRGFGEDPQCETHELRTRIDQVASQDAALRVTDLAIDGHDVMRLLGIAGGRKVGEVLESLLEAVLDEPALNTREELERRVTLGAEKELTP
jgi:putative nucleotidyltransferase with HDIG domain